MRDEGHNIVSLLQKLGLLDVVSSGMVGDAGYEIVGRSDPGKAGEWGEFMQSVLNLELRAEKKACVDFSRYYRLVSRRVIESMPSDATSPGEGRLVATAMALVWNWRVRFDVDGAALITQECARRLNLKAKKAQAAETVRQLESEGRARAPVQQTGIPEGIASVTPLSTGVQSSRPTKNVY